MQINIEKVQTRLRIAYIENKAEMVSLYNDLLKAFEKRPFEDMDFEFILKSDIGKYGLAIEDLHSLT